MDVKLVMFKRDGQRKDFAITREVTTIGRGDDCVFRIPLMSISRQHCKLVKSDDELQIHDLGSSNGTYINSHRVNETVLKAGDRITLGSETFTVQIDGKPEHIAPTRTKATKVAKSKSEDIFELDTEAGEFEETDPIAALEALAADADEEEQQ